MDPEDVVMLAVAYELKSPRLGTWTKQGWIDGWKNLRYVLLEASRYVISEHPPNLQRHLFFCIRCDGIEPMKQSLPRLRDRLGNDSDYFKSVYNHTFDFARSEGQRSLGEFSLSLSLFTKISFSQFVLMLSDISPF